MQKNWNTFYILFYKQSHRSIGFEKIVEYFRSADCSIEDISRNVLYLRK